MEKQKLALYGGKPTRDKPLPYMHPGASFIGEEEIRAVKKVLKSKSLFRYYGPDFLNFTGSFESDFKEYLDIKYVLGLNAGHSALHCALLGVGVEPEDEVIIPTYGWVACPCAVVACGAKPVLANVDESLTLDPQDVEDKISNRTKAIMAVHIRGVACDMEPIMKVAKKYQVKVVEDCAQAAGGSYRGKKLGTIGDAGAFSFQLNKMITAGEGGALATNDVKVYKFANLFHDEGALYREGKTSVEPIAGVNYRMTEVTAAIMTEQLKKIDKVIGLMRKHKGKIKKGISDIDAIRFRELPDPTGDTAVCLVFYLPTIKKTQEFERALHAENIYTTTGGYPPVIYHPKSFDGHVFVDWKHIFKGLDRVLDKYSRSLDFMSRAVHLDVSPILTDGDVNSIIEGVHKVAETLL
jgi:8-amino-3,8-dideoxy-alpha-D-manno-octulosonate transaminase